MTASFLHGVETIEVKKGAKPINTVKTAVIGLIGTAPTFEVSDAYKTINDLTLLTNQKDHINYFGNNRKGYTIPDALDSINDQGGAVVLAVNVFNPDVHKTTVSAESKAFVAGVINLGHCGIQNLVVKSADGNTTYVAGTDYTLDAIEGVITVKGATLTATSAVQLTYTYADPSKVTSADIIGSVVNGKRTGLQVFQDAFSKLGYFAKILIAPEFEEKAEVATEIDVIAGKTGAVSPIGLAEGKTVAQAISARGEEGSNFNTSSNRLIPCYPKVKKYNTTTEETYLAPISPIIAGAMAYKDLDKGYWYSVSNTEIKGIIGVEVPLTSQINDPLSEVNQLNAAGILTVRNNYGEGYKTWGNRSAAFPSNSDVDNFVCVRRTADIIEESIEYYAAQRNDQPIDNALIKAVLDDVNAFLRTLAGKGAIIDGKCYFDKNANPSTELANGHIQFDYEFLPPSPAERITFKSCINTDLYKTLGGSN